MRSGHNHPILHFSSSSTLLLLSLVLFLVLMSLGTDCSAAPITTSSLACNGSVAECGRDEEDVEMQMESEISRRILAFQRQINYIALKRDLAPLSGVKGRPYSKNLPANRPNRGCSRIYDCRHK
ncbi:hypothetical protein Scep_010686 [Stephania cephalantha]|uniref:Protein RALF-like 32 n=1 Tax=Stephania cephalantha TaxID=152367 RepID=A0AAP0JWJ6_9MAGN